MRRGSTLLLLAVAKDGFEGYKSEEFPFYGGWITSQELLAEDAALPIVDKYEYASGMQSLRLKSGDGRAALMVKRFVLPERFPFDTSDGTFAIANEAQVFAKSITSAESREETSGTRARNRERRQERLARRQKAPKSASSEESTTIRSKSAQSTKTQAGTETDSTTRTLSASTSGGSFYIYSITGVLLAEYSRYSDTVPVKDYIYVGGRLLAEYKPQESRTYFYTPDQINSTRVVTDESGTVVYSAAHDPYGGIQNTWVNTYDPTPKFSGKERDSESGLDYFGARYYNRFQYRFISVDPVINPGAMVNPQRWNLYNYCGNNPTRFIDPEGKSYLEWWPDLQVLRLYSDDGILRGEWNASNYVATGYSPFEDGSYEVNNFYNSETIDAGTPESQYGSYGWLTVVGNHGKVIHSGRVGNTDGFERSGWQHCTHGCIRTTDEAMGSMFNWNTFDKITRINTIRIVNTALPPPNPMPSWVVAPDVF